LSKLQALANLLVSWGPWGILLLSVLDSAGIPFPDVVDLMIVTIANRHARAGYVSAGLAVAGSVAGSVFLFFLGRKGGEAYLDKRTEVGWPRRFRHWFHHYGGITVFIPALLPVPLPLKIFVLSAGALGMRRHHFVVLMLAARIPRYFGLAYLGDQLGAEPIDYLKTHVWQLLALSVALFFVLALMVKVMERLRHGPRHLRF
jgi:membrane protein DedA with SNARE-associated domain